MKLGRRHVFTAAAAAVALFGVASCASDGGTGGEEERIYVEALVEDPESFNAQLTNGPTPTMFSSLVFDPLVQIGTDYEITPALAESWEFSEDDKELTFHLRDDVTWHDGEPFTADDVKFNIDEIVPLQSFGAQLAEYVEGTEIIDESTVKVVFSEVFGAALPTFAVQSMLPKHLYEGTDYVTNPHNMEPIGTGPLKFESYSSGEEVVLLKNEDYWAYDTEVDRAVFPIMPDPDSRAVALFAGELDRASIDASQQERVADEDNLKLLTDATFSQDITIMFNAETEELSDPEVRKLVFSALNREAIVESALAGLGEPATGFFPDSLEWALNTDIDFDTDYPFDVDAINDALDEYYPRDNDGVRFELETQYITALPDVSAVAEMAKSMLADVGIELNLVGSTSAIFTDKVYTESAFDLAFLRSTVGSDPSSGIVRWYACNPDGRAASNPSGICDSEIEDAAADAISTTDENERGEGYKRLQARANELMFYAPVAWYDGAFPTINSERWEGQDSDVAVASRLPLEHMVWVD